MTYIPRFTRVYHPELAAKMEARVTLDTVSGCWNWTKGVNSDGYGYGLYFEGKQHRAHRCAYLVSMGDLPPTEFPIRHLCSNPACCRPDHLAVGTHAENADDTIKAGRRRSCRTPFAQRRERAAAMRQLGGRIEEIAARFNVSQSTARRAVRGQTWAQLPGARDAKPNGEHKRKLTKEDVRAIRASTETNKELATRYGVTAAAIHAVVARKSWRHVD
ncbi:HNH endonuclease [Sphingomonas crocodyli]|uniref:HNH endonuclease n=1 Tax=Sphingomonas crocodyli TaxID=1979270 RepID=A0A437M192_9SPHN|nr:HNH endonuclease [Sphingomonas crocodyli]RVT91294.1 HNH endonuclease [Sphingomonas crocodyli]